MWTEQALAPEHARMRSVQQQAHELFKGTVLDMCTAPESVSGLRAAKTYNRIVSQACQPRPHCPLARRILANEGTLRVGHGTLALQAAHRARHRVQKAVHRLDAVRKHGPFARRAKTWRHAPADPFLCRGKCVATRDVVHCAPRGPGNDSLAGASRPALCRFQCRFLDTLRVRYGVTCVDSSQPEEIRTAAPSNSR